MKYRIFLSTILFFLSPLVLAQDNGETANIFDPKMLSIPPSLQTKWTAFLKEQGVSPEFQTAMNNASQRYAKAIEVLGAKTKDCYPQTADTTWFDRAVAKFGKSEIKNLKKDFVDSIASMNVETRMNCVAAAQKDAIYAEFQLLPFITQNSELLNTYTSRLDKTQQEQLKPLMTFLSKAKTSPTPLQVILNPMLDLQRLERRGKVNPKVWQFISKDPAFTKPFGLTKVIEPLTQNTK